MKKKELEKRLKKSKNVQRVLKDIVYAQTMNTSPDRRYGMIVGILVGAEMLYFKENEEDKNDEES